MNTTTNTHKFNGMAFHKIIEEFGLWTDSDTKVVAMLERDAEEFEYVNRQMVELSNEIIRTSQTVIEHIANRNRPIYASHLAGKADRLTELNFKWGSIVDSCCRLISILANTLTDDYAPEDIDESLLEDKAEFNRQMRNVIFGVLVSN